MAKLKTTEQKERDRNTRLLRTYGITAFEYKMILQNQEGVCRICGSDGGLRRLHVDHDHKWGQIKVETIKINEVWVTKAFYRGFLYRDFGLKKREAGQKIKLLLKRASIRGLLCWPCNRLLRSAFDQPQRLANAAKYLTDFQTFTASAPTKGE